MNSLYINLLIFLGSGLGGLCRYWSSLLIYYFFNQSFPLGTLFVNISGSLLIGIFFILTLERFGESAQFVRAFLLVGFLGGYTTFSSFSLETINLTLASTPIAALMNILLNVTLCLSAAWIGIKLGRLI